MTEHIITTSTTDGTTTIYVEREMGITTDKPALLGEIVRCRDCKHLLYDTCLLLSHELEGRYNCLHSGRDWDVKPEDFCAWGERKDGSDA